MAASLQACCRSAFVWTKISSPQSFLLKHFVRHYARGLKRTPIAVKTPTDEQQLLKSKGIRVQDPKQNPFLPFLPASDPIHKDFARKPSREPHGGPAKVVLPAVNKKQSVLKGKAGVDPSKVPKEVTKSGLKYERLQDGDKRFGRVLMAAKSRKEREKSGLILLEGRRLIVDSVRAGAKLKYLYFTDTSLLSGLSQDSLVGAELYKVQYRHLKLWADTQTPAGILGVFAKPAMGEVVCPQDDCLPMTLICDNIRDPGNLGTILRTAAAAGCKKIITSKGCVDVWDPKVLRGAMGGHFYTCILNGLPWEDIANYVSPSTYLCIADSRKSSAVKKSFDASHPKVVQLLDEATKEGSDSEETDNDDDGTSTDEEASHDEDEKSTWSRKRSAAYERVPLSIVQYNRMDCAGAKEVAVIVGGETEGVSAQARKLAFDNYGQFVTVPMVEAADSLNTATAAAIVLYEVRRLLTEEAKRKSSSRKVTGTQGVTASS